MSKIKLLSEQVYNKIAAGEVVERPASVVKELVENALDAGAGHIAVIIEKAGTKLILVTDDGEGMDEDDALMCMESHATSKISKAEDIFAIHSFGFRGEAIPSIASVSRMSIRTRRRDESCGVEVVEQGGKMIAANPVGCAPGTEIAVRDLFFNVPARKKFLKSDATEERHIVTTITNISLAHSQVSFELKADGRLIFSSPASSSILPRVSELFGRDFANALLPVSKSEDGIKVTGYISGRGYTRASRVDQRVFVNGRPVESQAVYRGIREGCGPMLEYGRHQAAILFLSMKPEQVDVNVHPAKREVRFHDENSVANAVRSAVLSALRAGDPVVQEPWKGASGEGAGKAIYQDFAPQGKRESDPDTANNTEPKTADGVFHDGAANSESGSAGMISPVPSVSSCFVPSAQPPSLSGKESGKTDDDNLQVLSLEQFMQCAWLDYRTDGTQNVQQNLQIKLESEENMTENMTEESVTFDQKSAESDSGKNPDRAMFAPDKLKVLGVVQDSYVICASSKGLVVIDQHAAHERVMYERILKGVDGALSQRLLIPVTLEISRADMLFVTRNTDDFIKVGYEIEPFGSNTLILNGIPAILPQNNAGGMFMDMLSNIAESGVTQTYPLDRIAKAACRAAVKAHDHLTVAECEALIRQMGECELPFACPHGRPTVLNITLNEIERRFGRK